MPQSPTPGQFRRACASVLEEERGLTVRQIVARLKRQGITSASTRRLEQELLAAPTVFRHDQSHPTRWSVDAKWREALRPEPTVLRYLQLENWKAFATTALQFRDVNLLFGENSAGKSSVLQALLLLKQTYGHGQFRFEGEYGSFGDLNNVVHRHDESAELRLIAGWEMQLEPGLVLMGLSADALQSVTDPEMSGRIQTIMYSPVALVWGT